MKKMIAITLLLAGFGYTAAYCQTNDFYDDAENVKLSVPSITIGGEIANPGAVELNSLPLRSVVVKETLLQEGKDHFVGAYRYDGYSLYDILNLVVLKKKNQDKFPPIIDLYVEVSNDRNEKVVFSWGEIYYAIHRHEILVATQVARIVPSKTKDLWPLPTESRLIVASDLLTHRNISNPTIINIRSYAGDFVINKGMKPMYAESFTVSDKSGKLKEFNSLSSQLTSYTYPDVFYGRGTGIHGTTPFTGVLLKDVLKDLVKVDAEYLEKGLIVIAAKDGYHAAYSFSEVMNRNDQAEFLVVPTEKNEDGGAFKIFPSADFFSDRAIKSVESILFVLDD
ncbi:MAG: hypothetical protein HXX13_10890 [Bacteroidetes bacterium]|nr:hypothetical protein [Bacteroidota bacterium]